MLFSLTEKEKAEKALSRIKEYNEREHAEFPISGFIVAVEDYGF